MRYLPPVTSATPISPADTPLRSRRAVLALLSGAVATGAGALAACGAPGGQPSSSLSQEAALISFLGRGSVTNQQSFEELSKRFSQENPKISVQYTHEPGNFDEKYQVLAAGGQTPDVAFGTVAFYKVHVARGIAGPLDELAKRDKQFKEADYDAYWLEALRYKGRLSGLPWDPGMVVLQFNRNLLQKAGVKAPDATTPMMWDDTLDLAKRLTKDTGAGMDPWGLDVWWDRMWWQAPRQMGLLDVYKGDENVLKLDDPVAIDAIQWLADLRVKHKVSRPLAWAPPADFKSGKVAMAALGAWEAANNRRDLQDDWDWAPLPQFKGKQRVAMGQASPFIMSAASKAKDQSWLLMRYLSGPVGQQMAMERGTSQPMLKAQAKSEAFTKLTPPHTHSVVVEETKYGVPPPYGPTYNDVQALVTKVLTPVYNGEQTARQALTAAQPEFKRIMEESKSRFG